jgi:hypothetical protein
VSKAGNHHRWLRAAIFVGAAGFAPATAAMTGGGIYAIACRGIAIYADSNEKLGRPRKSFLPSQTFVIDDVARTVSRALEPLKMLDEVCSTGAQTRTVDFTAHHVKIVSVDGGGEHTRVSCEFNTDRKSMKTSYAISFDQPDGEFHRFLWTMTCKPVRLPAFGPAKKGE